MSQGSRGKVENHSGRCGSVIDEGGKIEVPKTSNFWFHIVFVFNIIIFPWGLKNIKFSHYAFLDCEKGKNVI